MTRSDRTTTRAAGVLGPPRRRASALLFHRLPLTFGFNRVGFFLFFRVTHPSFGVPGASLARVAAARLSRPRPPSGDAHRVWGVAVTECRVFEIRVARRAPSASERAPWVPSAYVPSVVTPFIVPLGLPIQKPFILALPPVSAAPPASPRGAPGCPRRWRSSRNPSRSASPVRPPRPPETSRSSTSPT